jgi:hypothetical protein
MNQLPEWRITAIAYLSLLAMTGCGSGRPDVAPVRGTVSLNGKPVTTGRIMFYPTAGRPACAPINSDGTYVLTTFESDDGALIGTHRVTITSTEVVGPPPRGPEDEYKINKERIPVVKWLTPQQYSDPTTTDLKAEVKPQNNQIDFGLKSPLSGRPRKEM